MIPLSGNRTNGRARAATLLAGVLLTACSDSLEPRPSVPAPANDLIPSRAETARRGVEGEFLEIERTVPGFGGLFVDTSGDIVAYVTDPARAEQAREAVLTRLASDGPMGRRNVPGVSLNVRVVTGKFSMSQLVSWQGVMYHALAGLPGVNLLDADERANRVRIGVVSASEVPTVEAFAARSGIPKDALLFEVREGELSSAADVDDRHSDIHGGIIIRWTSNSWCTLGFNVKKWTSPDEYFLTASHCANSYTGGGSNQYQATVATLNHLGIINNNPAWSTTTCRPGATYCRNTDAALYAHTGSRQAMGDMAETTTIGSGGSGNKTIGTYRPIGATSDGLTGDFVYKTGATTGTTSGTILGTCANPGVFAPDGTEVFCSHEVEMWGAGGDSGSGIYMWMPPLVSSSRAALGVFWGIYSGPGARKIYYSPNSLIQNEMGITYGPI